MRTPLFVSFLLGVAALPAQDRDFGVAVPTTLTTVRSEPEAFKNVKVQFTLQFASLGKLSNPFFTKFTPTDYANFYGSKPAAALAYHFGHLATGLEAGWS